MDVLGKDVAILILKKIPPKNLPDICNQNKNMKRVCSDKNFTREYYKLWKDGIDTLSGKNLLLLKTFYEYIPKDDDIFQKYMRDAVIANNIQILDYLIEHTNLKDDYIYYLALYTDRLKPETLKHILTKKNIPKDLYKLFESIIRSNRCDLLTYIIKYGKFDPSYNENWAVIIASKNNK